MEELKDPRLCTEPTACKNFQHSWNSGHSKCSGCAGDFTRLRLVAKILDQHLDPIINGIHLTADKRYIESLAKASRAIREDMVSQVDDEITGQEVALAINKRLMQRVQTLEAALRLRM